MTTNLQRRYKHVTGFAKILTLLAAGGLFILAGFASAQADDSRSFFYVVTHEFYAGDEDLSAAVMEEFGPNAEVAEWNEIRELYGASLRESERFALRNGLDWNEHLWVTYDGERVFPGRGLLGEEGRTRYYFLSRWDGNKPENYEAHDQIQADFLTLGSWYDLNWRVLVKVYR